MEKEKTPVERVQEWYERETGLSAAHGANRILNVLQYANEYSAGLEELEIVNHPDAQWPKWKVRTERERTARAIGRITKKQGSGYFNCYYYVLLTEAAWNRRQAQKAAVAAAGGAA